MTRSAAEIGAGLAPARAPRQIRKGERIHVVGIAGAGASAAALLAARAGALVDGCDAGGPGPYTAALEAAGVPLRWRHDARHVTEGRPERLAVTKALTSTTPHHPELAAARAAGAPVEPWQQLVADAAATTGQRLVAVAGTHGKSTTASWLVEILVAAGRDPSAFVGALLPAEVTGGPPATARWGRGDAFVVEADEYAGNFDAFRPGVAILVSVEWDHPDVFADETAVVEAFAGWLGAAVAAGEGSGAGAPTLVANVGDAGVRRTLDRLGGWPGRLVAIALQTEEARPASGLALAGQIVAEAPAGTELEIAGLGPGGGAERVRLQLTGRHAAQDGLAAAGAALALGVAPAGIAAGLERFRGAWRRLELKGEAGGVAVLDDYGHHPSAIAATLAAARQRYPGRRLWAVYEPLTYHRTAAMLGAFAGVLATADAVAVAEIWAGRDRDTTLTSAGALAAAVNLLRPGLAAAPGTVEETAAHLAGAVRRGDVVVVMGGGRSYRIAELLVERLSSAGAGAPR